MLEVIGMPVVSPLARELVFKVVYYGPGLGGKTTTLQYIHATAKPEHRGKMVSLATPVDRTLYFDFLPIRMPPVRGMSVRLQLFTVPGQVYYNATRKLVLTGADAVVAVYDSQRARMDANLESFENLKENLRAHGKSLDEVPHVIQYNKRDLYDVLPMEELDRQLNPVNAPSFATTATSGEGVYESLEAITRAALDDFSRRVPESRAVDPNSRLQLPEGGLIEALRMAEANPAFAADSNHPRVSATPPEPPSPSMIRLSQLPEADPGEAAARAAAGETPVPPSPKTTRAVDTPNLKRLSEHPPFAPHPVPPPPAEVSPALALGSVSFEALWPAPERASVRELEAALGRGEYMRALFAADRLLGRVLANTGAFLGGAQDAPRDPATVALLLGLEGQRYLELRAVVREARSGKQPSLTDALGAYATALEARRLRSRIAR
ncbi:MAG: GTPase domain-containing protein [Polyangiaceae bacterium]